jgi:predicted esterase
MLRSLLACIFACSLACAFAPRAAAQALEPATPEIINAEARYVELPGPQPNTARGIYVWRAPSTPGGILLPTLYMADGAPGLYIAAARLRPAIEAGLIPPIQIIGIDPAPDRRDRTSEYIDRGRERFRAHEQWVLESVIPWAERVARADPTRRAIGGYSNGAAFAIFMGAAHPDAFIGVLAHSPVAAAETFHASPQAAQARWAMSAGQREYNGYPERAVSVVSAVVRGEGAEVRACSGPWGHEPEKWIDLSPGALAWVFRFANAEQVATPLERESCVISAPSRSH